MLLALLTPAIAYWLSVLWLFVLGGAVGSFLNVVVYRLPAQKSLLRPGSHCPACQHPIRWHDNVPVLSWVLLRGRCRDCGTKISGRYPFVEAVTAVLFVLIGVAEGLSCGANLPLEARIMMDGAPLPPLGIGQSAALMGYHLLLLCTLLAAALIEYDGHRVTVRLFVPALIVGWLAPLVCPPLRPVPAWPGLSGPIVGLLDGAAGFGAGLLLGRAFRPFLGSKGDLGPLLGPACVGLFLGWQAVLVLTLITAAVQLLLFALRKLRPGLRPLPLPGWLAAAALAWILAWGWIVSRCPFPG